jgi:hypothetical protein
MATMNAHHEPGVRIEDRCGMQHVECLGSVTCMHRASISKIVAADGTGEQGMHDVQWKFSPGAAGMTLLARGGVNLGDVVARK